MSDQSKTKKVLASTGLALQILNVLLDGGTKVPPPVIPDHESTDVSELLSSVDLGRLLDQEHELMARLVDIRLLRTIKLTFLDQQTGSHA